MIPDRLKQRICELPPEQHARLMAMVNRRVKHTLKPLAVAPGDLSTRAISRAFNVCESDIRRTCTQIRNKLLT